MAAAGTRLGTGERNSAGRVVVVVSNVPCRIWGGQPHEQHSPVVWPAFIRQWSGEIYINIDNHLHGEAKFLVSGKQSRPRPVVVLCLATGYEHRPVADEEWELIKAPRVNKLSGANPMRGSVPICRLQNREAQAGPHQREVEPGSKFSPIMVRVP